MDDLSGLQNSLIQVALDAQAALDELNAGRDAIAGEVAQRMAHRARITAELLAPESSSPALFDRQ